MKIIILVSITTLATGCASVTDVVSTGPGTYLVASQGVIGNGSGAMQKVTAIQRAEAYCRTRDAQLKIIKSDQSEPMFGRAPSGQVEFSCEKM